MRKVISYTDEMFMMEPISYKIKQTEKNENSVGY